LYDLEVVNAAHGSKLAAPMAAQWREFCDERPKTFEELKVHSSLPTWNFSLRPPADVAELANNGRTAAQLAQQQAMANAVHVGQPRTITSSVADGDEGRADRDARTADAAMRGMRTALVQNEWIMHKAKCDCCDFALNTGPTSCGVVVTSRSCSVRFTAPLASWTPLTPTRVSRSSAGSPKMDVMLVIGASGSWMVANDHS